MLKIFNINKLLQIGIYMLKLLHSGHNTVIHSQHDYPTRTRDYLRTPAHNLTIFKHSLSFTNPKICNSIPSNMKRNCNSLNNFKKL